MGVPIAAPPAAERPPSLASRCNTSAELFRRHGWADISRPPPRTVLRRMRKPACECPGVSAVPWRQSVERHRSAENRRKGCEDARPVPSGNFRFGSSSCRPLTRGLHSSCASRPGSSRGHREPSCAASSVASSLEHTPRSDQSSERSGVCSSQPSARSTRSDYSLAIKFAQDFLVKVNDSDGPSAPPIPCVEPVSGQPMGSRPRGRVALPPLPPSHRSSTATKEAPLSGSVAEPTYSGTLSGRMLGVSLSEPTLPSPIREPLAPRGRCYRPRGVSGASAAEGMPQVHHSPRRSGSHTETVVDASFAIRLCDSLREWIPEAKPRGVEASA